MYSQWATIETCDPRDMWSKWWGHMTWYTNLQKGNICRYHRYIVYHWDNRPWISRYWRPPISETQITFLTIENNNINIHGDPSIKSDKGQHLQFLRCFDLWHFWYSGVVFVHPAALLAYKWLLLPRVVAGLHILLTVGSTRPLDKPSNAVFTQTSKQWRGSKN